ncbi:MAG: PilX N-terminal domain-containing pilus assembly protein [Burkholderiaceae bacterium]|nr:PilX N-terminal domain-containing pilus assembly protein [Burkholderiaceae bacterium]
MNRYTTGTPTARRQRGFAALAVTLLLFFTMLLVAAYANRGLLFEQRASANQYRATQAFEAAEAGLEWAVAQLNHPQRIDAHCLPSAAATDPSFRERFVRVELDSGQQAPVEWMSGGTPVALQPACVLGAAGWSCSCPASGHPALDVVEIDDGTPRPAYSVQFSAEAQAGLIRVTSTGCSSAAGPCRPGMAGSPDASVRLQVVLGLLPGVSIAPMAPLTVRGSVDAGAAALGLHNPDGATGGITLHAGGSLIGTALRLTTAPGGVAAASASTHDEALASIDPDRLFASHFGLDRENWKSQAAVQTVACPNECGRAVAAAIGNASGNRMISIGGDARIDGPLTLGSPEHPVVIVVGGGVTLTGDVTLHGLLYAADVHWDGAAHPQASVRGAVISESGYSGTGAPDLHHDAELLRSLQRQTGSYARVPGSWRDF